MSCELRFTKVAAMEKKSPLTEFKPQGSFTQKHLTQWLPTSKKNSRIFRLKLSSIVKPLRVITSFTTVARQLFTGNHLARAFTPEKKASVNSKFKLQCNVKKKSVKNSLRVTSVLALVLIAVAATCTTYAALSVTQNVPSSGSIVVTAGLGIYSDSACQNNLTSIDWGTLTPGANIVRTVYVKNTGMGTSLSLSMATSNWTPASANGPVTITWNQAGTRLAPGQSTAAVITLTVSPTIADITSFNVQITITGTQ
jgi:hypothetical protein